VGDKDMFDEKLPKARRAYGARLKSMVLGKAPGQSLSDSALFELSSVDMFVAFYEDHLEYRRRLGSKHGAVAFADIRSVELIKKIPTSVSVGTKTVFDVSRAYAKKMVLSLDSRRTPLVFDFRTEALDDVQEAMDLIGRHLDHVRARAGDHPDGPSNAHRSRADELTKLGELRTAGVLSDEEFEREKARVLNS
jgi:hypothetical protein